MAKKEVNSELIERWREKLSHRHNLTVLMDFLQKLTEEEKRELAPVAIKSITEIQAVGECLTIIAAANNAELKRVNSKYPRFWMQYYTSEAKLVRQLLEARDPKWLAEWAEWMIDTQFPEFWLIQPLVEKKIIPLPRHQNYVALCVSNLHAYYWQQHMPKKATADDCNQLQIEFSLERYFEEHLEMLVVIPYGLFDISGNMPANLTSHVVFSDQHGWAATLRNLANKSLLNRAKLLSLSLQAMNSDLSQYHLRWYFHFYEVCDPTIEELLGHKKQLMHLLGSKVSTTVSFAMNYLKKLLQAQKRLDADSLIPSLEMILRSPVKGTVSTALELLSLLLKQEPKAKATVTLAIAEALGHEKVDVQKQLAKYLRKHADSSHSALRSAIQEQLPQLSASIREELKEWLGEDASPTPSASMPTMEQDWSTLHERIEQIAEPWRSRCGLDQMKETIPNAIAFSYKDIPLFNADRIQPIATLEECIERTAKWLETPTDGIEMECILDGLSRFCADRPPEFEAWTGPLLARVKRLTKDIEHWFTLQTTHSVRNLSEVIYCWLAKEGLTLHYVGKRKDGPRVDLEGWEFRRGDKSFRLNSNVVHRTFEFVPLRCLHLSQRIYRQVALPLLSMPTHRQGWIDATTLIERTTLWLDADEPIPIQEQVLALLRLHTHHQVDTQPLGKYTHHFAQALRLALGDRMEVPGAGDETVWLSALQAAKPEKNIDALRNQVNHMRQPDANSNKEATSESQELRSVITPYYWPVPKLIDSRDWIAAILARSSRFFDQFRTWDKAVDEGFQRWLPSTWPRGREPFYDARLRRLIKNLDWTEKRWADVVLLEPLLDADEPLVGSTLLTVAFLLSAKESGQQRLATDVLISGINDGRLDAISLGTALGQVLRFPRTKAARLVRGLSDARHGGPLCQWMLLAALEQAMVEPIPTPSRDLSSLLEVWYEWATEASKGITHPDARKTLETFTSGKLAKLAKQLLAITDQPNSKLYEAARYQAAEGRVQRAERWMGNTNLQ